MAGVLNARAEIDMAADGRMTAMHADFSRLKGNLRPAVEGLARELTETLRAVNPPLLGRELKPGESWPGESPFQFPIDRSVSKGVFHLTHTYVGVRDRAGRREAIIEVSGDATPSRDKDSGGVAGKAVGAFAVDVQTGQVRLADVESDLILEMDGLGPDGKTAKTKTGMVLEIRFQRGPKDGPPLPAVMPLPNGRIDFRPFAPLPGAGTKP